MRAPQPPLIPRTVRGKNGHLPLDRRVVQLAPPAFFARLPIANQLRKETPDGGLTHEVVTAPRNRVNSTGIGKFESVLLGREVVEMLDGKVRVPLASQPQ